MTVCCLISSYSSGVQRPRLQQHGIRNADLPDIVKKAAARERRDVVLVEPERPAQRGGVLRETLAMAVGRAVARFDRQARG